MLTKVIVKSWELPMLTGVGGDHNGGRHGHGEMEDAGGRRSRRVLGV